MGLLQFAPSHAIATKLTAHGSLPTKIRDRHIATMTVAALCRPPSSTRLHDRRSRIGARRPAKWREAARIGDQAASIADHATDASRDAADVARDTATEIADTTASVAKRAAERLHDAMLSRAERDICSGTPPRVRLGSHLHSTAPGIFAIVNSGRASWLRS